MQLSAFIIPNQPLTGSKNCVKVCMIFLNIFQKLTYINKKFDWLAPNVTGQSNETKGQPQGEY